MKLLNRSLPILSGALLLTVGAFSLGVLVGPEANRSAKAQASPRATAASPVVPEDMVLTAGTFRRIAARARPAVVSITSSREMQQSRRRQGADDFFEWFFGPRGPNPMPRQRESIGSGLIISADGEILTNQHVVEGSSDIIVSLQDGREFEAEVMGRDPELDIALIKVEGGEDLPVLEFGDSDALMVGDWVMAIGNPFEFGFSVTVGVVSAKERVLNGPYDDFIQTDAAINPGNSGGPLLDLAGRVVGVNTAISTGGIRQSAGVGFAIPIDMIQEILPQLRRKGRVDRGFLGVFPQDVSPELARGLDLPAARGALVSQVDPNTPADAAGLEPYDVILEWDGRQVEDSKHLRRLVALTPPGEKVPVTVLRDGRRRKLEVTVVRRDPERLAQGVTPPSGDGGRLGIEIQDVTPELAERLDLPVEEGVFITSVEPGSVAQRAGLRRGDVILEVNQQTVEGIRDFARMIRRSAGETAILRIRRNRSAIVIPVQVPE